MYHPESEHMRNHILQNLPNKEYEQLSPHLEPIPFLYGEVLSDVGAPVTYGYFLESGLVSTQAVMRNGRSVEVGLLGSEGFVGLPILLNIAHFSSRLVMQIPGNTLRIRSDKLHPLLPKLGTLENLLSRFAYLQALQLEQVAACHILHDFKPRLARWLLMAADRVSIKDLPLTQIKLASILGVRRATIADAASALQSVGAIEYERGCIRILSCPKLAGIACECYSVVSSQLQAYLKTSAETRPEV